MYQLNLENEKRNFGKIINVPSVFCTLKTKIISAFISFCQNSKSAISKKWFAKYFFENVPGPKSFPTGSARKNKRDVLKKYHDVL